jgi:site-specific DNA recombinase
MDKLTDLFLDSDISKEEYETKRQQLTQRREDIIKEISGHDKADDSFAKMLVSLVELASNALETFRGSNLEQKRKLINLVFSNLTLKGEKLDYHLRSPFDMFVKLPKNPEWRTLKDSNLRPTD